MSFLPTASPFDTVLGLPLHPLVVHAAVVLLPLSALGVIALVLVRRWRRGFAWLTLLGLLAGAGAAFVAKESGEQLAKHVGEPEDHAKWGDILPLGAGVLLLVAGIWLILAWRAARPRTSQAVTSTTPKPSALVTILGAISALLALAVIGLTVLVGHSGAQAVWNGRATTASTGPTSSPTTAGTPSTSPSTSGGVPATGAAGSASASSTTSGTAGRYTMAQVREHRTTSSCWTVVNGKVYDLTNWIRRHPGGQQPIESLCGTDGTASFTGQHGSERRPNNELDGFRIGDLAP